MKASSGLAVALVVCALAGIGVLGCNSVKGVGKNIEKNGNGIHNTTDKSPNGIRYAKTRQFTITASAEPGGSISPIANIGIDRPIQEKEK